MDIIFSASAKKEMENLELELKYLFVEHNIKGDLIYVLHCFADHKGYERWFKSYK